jgi:phosphoribosylformylglycinamidine cyclo-ligase
MRASGLHSNGYSLARHVLLTTGQLRLDQHVDVLGRTLGEELLEPTRIYSLDCLDLARAADVDVHAFSHVTGGGLAANLARVLPADIHVVLDRGTWTPHPVFGLVGDMGRVALPELEKTFNMGVGMIALVSPETADVALARLAARGVDAWILGEARARLGAEPGDAPPKGGLGGAVTLTGTHAP